MKAIFAGAALLAAVTANAQSATYTLADVANHATASDCWMVLNSTEVYNVTAFIPLHPGGNAMVPYCGKDGTQAFNSIGHSSHAVALEATYLIGMLVAAPQPVSIAITPTSAMANVGETVQFTPKLTNSSAGVAWTVNPTSLGTISSNGLFTAVTAGGGTVTATSTQDKTKSASASITVTAAPPQPQAVAVTVAPSALSLSVGATHQFAANVKNSNAGVTWRVSGPIGTIDSNGLFTAGLTAGAGAVTATSVADPTKSATVEVSVTAAPQCRRSGSGNVSGQPPSTHTAVPHDE